jgi:hypothetical protein
MTSQDEITRTADRLKDALGAAADVMTASDSPVWGAAADVISSGDSLIWPCHSEMAPPAPLIRLHPGAGGAG